MATASLLANVTAPKLNDSFQEDEPRRPAILHRQAIQEAKNLGHRLHREPHDADNANMVLADPRSKTTDQVLGRDHRVQVHRDGRNSHLMPEPRDACVEVRQERGGVEAHQRQSGRQRVF